MECQSGDQFSMVQRLLLDKPAMIQSLLLRYQQVMGNFFTRDLRSILNECIVSERLDLLYQVDVDDESNRLLLLQPRIGLNAFVKDFHNRVLKYFDQAMPLCCSSIGDIGDRLNLAMEDRKLCFELEFKRFLSDQGYSFLLAVRELLDYEASLLKYAASSGTTSTSRQITLLKRKLSCDSVSEKSIVLTKFAKQVGHAPNRMKDIEAALKTFKDSEFLRPESISPALEAMTELASCFSSSFKRDLINDEIKNSELNSLAVTINGFEKLQRASHVLQNENAFKEKARQLFYRSFFVSTQSCQVIREKKHVKFEVQLLLGDFFSQYFQFENLGIDAVLLNEEAVKNLENRPVSDNWDQLSDANKIIFHEKNSLQLTRGNKFSIKLSLQVAKLPTRKNPVWAQKFVFCFRAQSSDSFSTFCQSRPVTFITNDNQRMESSACIAYENMFPLPVRLGFDVYDSITAEQCVELIDCYFFDEIKSNGFEGHNRSYFLKKCSELMQKTGKANRITFEDLIKVQFIGEVKPKSLWDFVYTCVKFIKDHGHSMWMKGLIFGFITKSEAINTIKRYIKSESNKTDFALLRFSETTATVTVCYSASTTDGCTPGNSTCRIENRCPKNESYFSSTALAKFCDDPLSTQTLIVTRSGSLENSSMLRDMIPIEDNVPGYVPLRRRGTSGSPENLSELASSIASVSVCSPIGSDLSLMSPSVTSECSQQQQQHSNPITDSNNPIPHDVMELVFDYQK